MSHFCFGEVELLPGWDPVQAAWEMLEAARRAGLFVMCGPTISQRSVFEMLTLRGWDWQHGVPFLLTGSPLEDTSCSVISSAEIEGAADVVAGFGRIGRWLELISRELRPRRIRLLMTEGFDDEFRTIETEDFDLEARLPELVEEWWYTPSIELLWRFGASLGAKEGAGERGDGHRGQ
jgi:hypothetical protein